MSGPTLDGPTLDGPTLDGRRLITLNSTGQVSGAERVLLRTMAAAVEQGWDVACLCPAGPLVEQLRATGARHVEIPELNLAAGPKPIATARTIGRWLTAARALRALARPGDVVLANTLLALPTVRLARLSRPEVRTLWLAHDVVVSAGRLRLYRWAARALSAVVGVSQAVVDELRPADRSGPPLTVVHNGVEFPVEPATGSSGDPVVVGLNGLLTSWKGQEVLLEATALVAAEAPVRVELIGGTLPKDADYAEGLRRRVADLGLSDRVSILGHTPDPLARMRTWDVAVSASTDPEACPLGVLEAMSLGLPVIATDHGGSPEVLDGAGLLVTPRDPAALAAAITRLARDPALRAERGEAGRSRVGRAHRLDVQTRTLLEFVAGGHREGRAS